MTANQWQIGKIKITRVIEIEAFGGMRRILPDADYEAVKAIPWLVPHFADADGRLGASIHTLIVETPDCRIVVDTCVGNDKDRLVPAWNQLQTNFLSDFQATGYALDSIDRVLCTHLHVDHVGWNTRLQDGRWVPTFANARYLMGADEVAFWQAGSDDKRFGPIYADSIKPIFDAGLVDLVSADHQVAPGVRLIATPGHTPGHVSNHLCFLLEEEGVLLAGDHIMNGSTVVIVPPSGDMKAYIESLQLLSTYPLKKIGPALGFCARAVLAEHPLQASSSPPVLF